MRGLLVRGISTSVRQALSVGLPVLVVTLVMVLVVGCTSSTPRIPVSSAGQRDEEGGRYHQVIRGETLYSIAWRYGLDYKQLATANKIEAPYTIYVDQKLTVPLSTDLSTDLSAVSSTGKQRVITPKKSSAPPARKVAPTSMPGSVRKPVTPPSRTPANGAIQWVWPLKGKILEQFAAGEGVNNGIDIEATRGQSVSSAADGIVVYAGGGLRGYGKLIIVKHSDRYLSAYGHNRALLVKEGQRVNGGQTVAEVGSNGSEGEMLHFEIRKDGKPDNPLKYLPGR